MGYKQTKTIGGTAVSAILGLNPWAGPWDAWDRIVNGRQVEPNEAMMRGVRLEPAIAEIAAQRLDMTLIEPLGGTIIIDETFSATPDRIGFRNGERKALIEIKTAGTYGKVDPMPEHYRLQVQHYLWALDLDVGYLVALKTTDEAFRMLDTAQDVAFALERNAAELIIHRIERDHNYSQEVIPALREWFARHVVNNEPPPADNSEACRSGLMRLYPERSGELEATQSILELVAHRNFAKEKEHESKMHRQHFENKLRAELGQHKTAKGGGYVVTLSRQRGRVSLDQKRLKDERPDIWDAYQKRGEDFETLRIRKVEN